MTKIKGYRDSALLAIRTWIRKWARLVIYVEIAVFAGLLGLAAITTNISAPNRATMTNTFAAVSGVFLGLYFVILGRESEKDWTVTQLLLFSIFASLISSLTSFDETNTSALSEFVLFVVSAITFGVSTAYFAIGTQLLGPLKKKNE